MTSFNPPSQAATAPFTPSHTLKSLLIFLFVLYFIIFFLLSTTQTAQSHLLYLHLLRPPVTFFPPTDLRRHNLTSSARNIKANNLRGYHLLPPGPPYPPSPSFSTQLSAPRQRVILFFHGNAGTRATPSKRITHIKLLAAHLSAHVITFDYTGFADSPGTPSAAQLSLDATAMFDWIAARIAPDTDVILYGQSLGSFFAVSLAAAQGDAIRTGHSLAARALILDAAPASIIDAALTHPAVAPFRVVPWCEPFLRGVVKEPLDTVGAIGRVAVPLLVMHGARDAMIAVEQGERIYREARERGLDAQFVRFDAAGHNNVAREPTYLPALVAFVDRVCAAPVPRRPAYPSSLPESPAA